MTDGSDVALVLEGFGVAFGNRVVLADVSLEAHAPGMYLVLGPGGVGKSTLIRTLAGANDAQPALRTWGRAMINGSPIHGSRRPTLIIQNARFLTASVFENVISGHPHRAELELPQQRSCVLTALEESGLDCLRDRLEDSAFTLPLDLQRRLAIVRSVLSEPRVLCVDEPAAGLDDADASDVLEHLRRESERRCLIIVSRHLGRARMLGGHGILLAGGRVQEHGPVRELLSEPRTEAGQQFVRTGSCSVPHPAAVAEDLDDLTPAPRPLPAAAVQAVASWQGPRGFHWLLPGQLGGAPRPGIVAALDTDLEALQRVGVSVLVTLEEEATVSYPALSRYGMSGLHFPIEDMQAPAFGQGVAFCRTVERLMFQGEVVALHCRAGHGRTGTMLAAQLIWRGATAVEALERARLINPRWIQSSAQVEFLADFERGISQFDFDPTKH